MIKTRSSTLIVLAALASQTGCYTTKVMANRSEERMEIVVDWLINVGLAVGGGTVGALACGDVDPSALL